MNPRIHYWLVFCLLWLAGLAHAQYNPANPPEPSIYYTLTLSATPSGAGTFSVSTPATYAAGASVRIKATATANYTFAAWMEGDSVLSTTAQFDYVMPWHDASLTARFTYTPSSPSEPNPPAEDTTTYAALHLSCSPTAGGSINIADGKLYLIGSSVTLKATAKTNFTFLNWTADGEVISTTAQFSYKVQRSGNELVANFEYTPSNPSEPTVIVPTYALTLSKTPSAGGTINLSSGNYPKGEVLDLVATPKSGYEFLRWTIDDEQLSDSASCTFIMPARAVSITAEFREIYNPSNPSEPSYCLVGSGSCGDSLKWELTCDYVLIIRGKGAMWDYSVTNVVPWNEHKHLIRTVLLPDELTYIGNLAFGSFARLASITIPAPVTQIGDSAFFRCRRLAAVFCKPVNPPAWGNQSFELVNRLIPLVVGKGLADTYRSATGWSEFVNVHEEPYIPSSVNIHGQEVVVIESNDTLTTVWEEVDVFGDSTMVYSTLDNSLTLSALVLTEADTISAAISYAGSEPLTIVLTDSSTIIADTVISSASDIVITGDGQLVAEGVTPIIGAATARITFDSVTMSVRSLPSSAAVRRRIRGGRKLDETGGPALSGFATADFNKTVVTPPEAEYGEVEVEESATGATVTINALYTMGSGGVRTALTAFTLNAMADVGTAVAVPESTPLLDPTQPMYNILGMQVSAGYRGIVIQGGRTYLLQ